MIGKPWNAQLQIITIQTPLIRSPKIVYYQMVRKTTLCPEESFCMRRSAGLLFYCTLPLVLFSTWYRTMYHTGTWYLVSCRTVNVLKLVMHLHGSSIRYGFVHQKSLWHRFVRFACVFFFVFINVESVVFFVRNVQTGSVIPLYTQIIK